MNDTGTDFNFGELVKKFSSFCLDFTNNLCTSQPSHAVEFCSKVLYEIGPESRKEKGRDRIWRMKFTYQDSQSKQYCRIVIIATNRPVTCEDTPECMCITVKEAGLLAMVTFNKLTDLAINTDVDKKIMLTPLAGAVFLKKDIHQIATELNTPIDEIIKNINSSCQSGGQHLNESRLYIAIVAAIASTRNKNKDIATRIIETNIKKYINKHKTMDDIKFNVYSKYAFGGIPDFIQVINKFKRRQKPSATSQSMLTSNIQVSAMGSGSMVNPPTSQIPYAHGHIPAYFIHQLINKFESQQMIRQGERQKLSATSQSISTSNIQLSAMGSGSLVIPPTSQTLKEGSPGGTSKGPVVGATGDSGSASGPYMQMPLAGGLPYGTQQQHAGDLPLPTETTSSSTSDDLSQVAGADASIKSADEISLIETEIKDLLL